MTAQKVTDMTVEDLRVLIVETVDEQFPQLRFQRPPSKRSVAEILESIERHRWTPPPGSPTMTELLREDRDHRQ